VVRRNEPALPNGTSISQYVGFRQALDFLIETRRKADTSAAVLLAPVGATRQAEAKAVVLKSCYVHVLEGFREGERSAIRSLDLLPVAEADVGPDEVVACA